MTENLNNYELNITFQASPKDAQAFNNAIAQVLVAWERHERLRNIIINLIDNPAEIE